MRDLQNCGLGPMLKFNFMNWQRLPLLISLGLLAFAWQPSLAYAQGELDIWRGWPTEPVVDSSLIETEGLPKPTAALRIDLKINPVPTEDPVQVLDSSFTGILTYVFSAIIADKDMAQTFIAFRRQGSINDLLNVRKVYPTYAVNWLYDPSLSVTGGVMAMKLGDPFGREAGYDIAMWDFRRKSLSLLHFPHSVAYPYLYWSPDGGAIAFVKGGDSQGLPITPTDIRNLHIFNLGTKAHTIIEESIEVVPSTPLNPDVWVPGASIAWAPNSRILYVVREDKPVIPEVKLKVGGPFRIPYSIHSVQVADGRSSLLIDSAINPQPSPDGSVMAFFGPKTAGKPLDGAKLQASEELCLSFFDMKTKKRSSLDTVGLGHIRWLPDGKKLLVVNQQYQLGKSKAELKLIDFHLGQVKSIATMDAKEFRPLSRMNDQFTILDINSKYAAINISEVTGFDMITYAERRTIKVVDLMSGDVKDLARAENVNSNCIGWDWKFER